MVSRLPRFLGHLLTGPLAFFAAGLLDLLAGLRLAAIYLWRTRVSRSG